MGKWIWATSGLALRYLMDSKMASCVIAGGTAAVALALGARVARPAPLGSKVGLGLRLAWAFHGRLVALGEGKAARALGA